MLKVEGSFNNKLEEKLFNNKFDNDYYPLLINYLTISNCANILDSGILVENPNNVFLAARWLLRAIKLSKTNDLVLIINTSDGGIISKRLSNIYKIVLWFLAAIKLSKVFDWIPASTLCWDLLGLLALSELKYFQINTR